MSSPSNYARCRCKHAHDQHDPELFHCVEKGCGCGAFASDFLCAACDKHWERHETFLETERDRRENKMPYGASYRPFNEMEELKAVRQHRPARAACSMRNAPMCSPSMPPSGHASATRRTLSPRSEGERVNPCPARLQ